MRTRHRAEVRRALPALVALGIVALALGAAGCFTTRVVRDETTTTVEVVRDTAAPATMAPDDGTLVVEALAPRPVRLPSSVAEASAPIPSAPETTRTAWAPLPSYVDRFVGPSWHALPIFGRGLAAPTPRQTYVGPGAWTPPGYGYGYGYGRVTPPAPSSSPHFSSPPAYSGY